MIKIKENNGEIATQGEEEGGGAQLRRSGVPRCTMRDTRSRCERRKGGRIGIGTRII